MNKVWKINAIDLAEQPRLQAVVAVPAPFLGEKGKTAHYWELQKIGNSASDSKMQGKQAKS